MEAHCYEPPTTPLALSTRRNLPTTQSRPHSINGMAQTTRRKGGSMKTQQVKQLIKDKRKEFNNGRTSEYPQKVLTELLEEVETA